jgi:hypothetical protein
MNPPPSHTNSMASLFSWYKIPCQATFLLEGISPADLIQERAQIFNNCVEHPTFFGYTVRLLQLQRIVEWPPLDRKNTPHPKPLSKREAHRNNPAVVVLMELRHRNLHAGAKA